VYACFVSLFGLATKLSERTGEFNLDRQDRLGQDRVMTRCILAFVFVVLSLVGCVPSNQQVRAPDTTVPDTCGSTAYLRLIGQDVTTLERELIMRPIRIVRPGDAVTMDYSAGRINFDIDRSGRIARITCG
jgi:hypothetical protein